MMVCMAILCVIVLAVLRIRLSREAGAHRKNCIALLVTPRQTIEMIIPISERRPKPMNHYSKLIQTETLHPCTETNADYYHSILAANELPYFPVRETNFHTCPRTPSLMSTDLNKGNYVAKA